MILMKMLLLIPVQYLPYFLVKRTASRTLNDNLSPNGKNWKNRKAAMDGLFFPQRIKIATFGYCRFTELLSSSVTLD